MCLAETVRVRDIAMTLGLRWVLANTRQKNTVTAHATEFQLTIIGAGSMVLVAAQLTSDSRHPVVIAGVARPVIGVLHDSRPHDSSW